MKVKVPSMLEVIKKVRGSPIPKSKRHRPKKGGPYTRTVEKRRLRKEV